MRLLEAVRRHPFLSIAAVASLVAAAVLAIAYLGPSGVYREPRCDDMSDSGCGAFLQALFGEVDGTVETVDAVMFCGMDECPVLFGGDSARFSVVYHDGSQDDFVCWRRMNDVGCDRVAD